MAGRDPRISFMNSKIHYSRKLLGGFPTVESSIAFIVDGTSGSIDFFTVYP